MNLRQRGRELSTAKWMRNHWNGIGKADTIQHTWEIRSRTGGTRFYISWAGEVTQLFGLQKTRCVHIPTLSSYVRALQNGVS